MFRAAGVLTTSTTTAILRGFPNSRKKSIFLTIIFPLTLFGCFLGHNDVLFTFAVGLGAVWRVEVAVGHAPLVNALDPGELPGPVAVPLFWGSSPGLGRLLHRPGGCSRVLAAAGNSRRGSSLSAE